MKKTVNINLSGMQFTIDEDAYSLLHEYLETLRRAFAAEPAGSDIVDDIECRIAELFSERLGDTSGIITLADVQQVIQRIGTVDQLAPSLPLDEAEDAKAPSHAPGEGVYGQGGAPVPPPTRKQLFRDTDDKVLGGVCAGLAHYFGLDPVWVRIIFVVLFFVSMSTLFFLYILLWVIIPPAVTPYQKMQMYGSPATMQNIWESVTDTFRATPGAPGTPPRQSTFMNILGIAGKCLLLLLALIALPTAIASIAAIVGAIILWVAMIFNGAAIETVLHTNFFIDSYSNAPDPMFTGLISLFLFCGGLALLIPCALIIWCCFSTFRIGMRMSKTWIISLLTIWVAACVALIISGFVWDARDYDDLHDTHVEAVFTPAELRADSLEMALDHLDDVTDQLKELHESYSTLPAHLRNTTLDSLQRSQLLHLQLKADSLRREIHTLTPH